MKSPSPPSATFHPALVPLAPPPPGQVSNFVDPPTRAPLIVALNIICLVLVWIIYPCRIYSKAFVSRALWWDDATVTLASIGVTGLIAVNLWSLKFIGPHSWDILVTKFPTDFERETVGGQLLNSNLTVFFTKMSLLLLYFRVFRPKRSMVVAIWIIGALIALVYLGDTIAFGVLCVKRPDQTWQQDEMYCLSHTSSIGFLLGVFGLISDIVLFVLPLPLLAKLNMPRKRKLSIILLFMTALLAPLCSTFGLFLRVQEYQESASDPAWDLGILDAVAVIEISVGIIVCSVPYLGPFIPRYNPTAIVDSIRRLLTRITRSSENKGSDHDVERLEMPLERRVYIRTFVLGTMESGKSMTAVQGSFGDEATQTTSFTCEEG